MLFALPTLDADDRRVLDELEQFRDDLRQRVTQPRRWLGQLRRSLTANAVRGSTTIEGYSISASNADALVAGEDMPDAVDAETEAAVTGYRDALTYVQESTAFEAFEYHHMLLSTLHFMMTKYRLDHWPGRYRPGGAWISGGHNRPPVYTAPEANEVLALMSELLDWLNTGDLDAPAYVRAAMAHLNLVSIHPWRDGNGRMARCLHTMVLARDSVLAPEFSSIEEWIGLGEENTLRYYHALASTGRTYDPTANTSAWLKFCLQAHHLQAQHVQLLATAWSRLWMDMAEVADAHTLPERMTTALYAAAVGNLRRTVYQKDENISRDSAIRDLRLLTQLRLIQPSGSGRSRYYIAGEAIHDKVTAMQQATSDLQLREPYPPRQ